MIHDVVSKDELSVTKDQAKHLVWSAIVDAIDMKCVAMHKSGLPVELTMLMVVNRMMAEPLISATVAMAAFLVASKENEAALIAKVSDLEAEIIELTMISAPVVTI